MKKTSCFAYENGKCTVLDVYKCDSCRFYKTKELLEHQREKAFKRAKKKGYYAGTLDYKTKGI